MLFVLSSTGNLRIAKLLIRQIDNPCLRPNLTYAINEILNIDNAKCTNNIICLVNYYINIIYKR